jgi:cytochrome oxidase Cu insertion factor (SCO1/SenC/PrrC family)
MLKKLRWFLYFVVVVLVGFNIWQYFQHKSAASNDPTLNKFKKDLGITEASVINPPNFTLTDQYGKVISLSDFKNKKVVITPIDPKCVTVCPLVAQEIHNANNQLGANSKNVVYIALNVNPNYNKVSDVKTFTDQHGLSAFKNWYFLTGSPAALKKMWAAYGFASVPIKGQANVMHTSEMIFVNSNGKEVYEGTPTDNGSTLQEWSNAISYIVKAMN